MVQKFTAHLLFELERAVSVRLGPRLEPIHLLDMEMHVPTPWVIGCQLEPIPKNKRANHFFGYCSSKWVDIEGGSEEIGLC